MHKQKHLECSCYPCVNMKIMSSVQMCDLCISACECYAIVVVHFLQKAMIACHHHVLFARVVQNMNYISNL